MADANLELLITQILALGLQYGPELVSDIAQLAKGNPQAQGQADADYIAGLKAQVQANTTKIDADDDAIQKEAAGEAAENKTAPGTTPVPGTTPTS